MGNTLSKYRIKDRLVRAFIFASGIPAVVAVLVLGVLIAISLIYSSTLTNEGFAQGEVGKTLKYFAETRSALRAVIGFDDEDFIATQLSSHQESKEQFEQSFADLEKYMVSDATKDLYNQISSKLDAYWQLDNEVITLGATPDAELSKQAQSRASTEMRPAYKEIEDLLMQIMDVKVERGDNKSDTMEVVCIVLVIASALAIIFALTTSIRLGKAIADGIVQPLTALGERLEGFAQGDLSSEFPEVELEDEVADMMAAAKDMAGELEFIISDMEYTLGEMANSNYTVSSKDSSRYMGDFQQLFESTRQLKYGMIDTMHFIEESSIQVTAGAGNLADTSLSLAEGATEQASAVEELQATITTISEASVQAAENAENSYHQSQEYADVADNSSADIREMVEAMSRINDASKKIGNIISEIESIASQTNLLSLNASIEAARAGEAGRGFSVVADQIRQLAEQSSKSAVDTRMLIEGAMLEIDNGNKVADRAVASIETVVEGIRKIAASSKELSVVSKSQAETMKEAEEGVNQISDVIQTNAAVAEESSATSQELSAQAASLDALIAKFKLPDK